MKISTIKTIRVSGLLFFFVGGFMGTVALWVMPNAMIECFVTDGPSQFRTWGVFEYAETGYFQLPEAMFSELWTRPESIHVFLWPFVLTLLATCVLWSSTVICIRLLIGREHLTTRLSEWLSPGAAGSRSP